MNVIKQAINKAKTKTEFAETCGVSRQAVLRWEEKKKLPRTEWTGETNYAEKIYLEYGIAIPPYTPPEETAA